MKLIKLLKESKLLLTLTLPLLISGLVEASLSFSSTAFLARLGQRELAAGALASWLFMTLMVIMWGILTAISVLVSRFYGAENHVAIARVLRDGFILSFILFIPAVFLLWYGVNILLFLNQDNSTIYLTELYLHSLSWAVLPDFIMLVLLQFVIGLGHTRVNMFFTFLWVPLNVAFNYGLIFGRFGLPKLGIAGIGWGTTASFWLTTFLLLLYLIVSKKYRAYFQFKSARLFPSQLGELLRIGLPMGVMYFLEIGFFLALTLLMGKFDYHALAANQITVQYLWLVSVVISCLAQAVTVRTGFNLGAQQVLRCKQTVRAGTCMAVGFMLLVAMVYWFFPTVIISVDLNVTRATNDQVVALAKQFLAVCALLQMTEAVRFTAFGALRSLKDTTFSLYISILTFWIIGLGVGYLLAFAFHWRGVGLWWGLLIGNLCAAVIFQWRANYKINQLALAYNNAG